MISENIILSKNFVWTDIERLQRMDFNFVEREFKIPRIYLQGSISPEHLPKYEKTQNGYFFLIRLYDTTSSREDITIQTLTNKLAIFIIDHNFVTIHSDLIVPLKKFTDMRRGPGLPTDARKLVHQLMRISVLSFEEGLFELQKEYEEFEREVISKETGTLSNTRVYEFRRKLYVVQGIIHLIRQTLYNSKEFWGEEDFLQHDIQENIDQLNFRFQGLSHNFDQLFALHLSMNEKRSNDVMKVLTVFASVMLPLTFIASFYGMNFEQLPGIHTTTGFVGALLIMATTTFVTVWFFNRKKWFRSSM